MKPGRGLEAPVLVLNKHYLAVRVVGAREAFRYLCKDTAEVVHHDQEQYDHHNFGAWIKLSGAVWGENGHGNGNGSKLDDWVSTVTLRIRVPRIIRLRDCERTPRMRVRPTRRNIFARDDYRCQYCRKALPARQLTVDHVLPRARGGPDGWTNLVTACLPCNDRKGRRTPVEAGMRLAHEPMEPRAHPLVTLALREERYHSWQPFVG